MLLFSCSHHSPQPSKNPEEVKTPQLSFSEGDREFKADLVLPEQIAGKLPLVIIVHEWWGKNEYVQKRAAMLAQLGYAALVVDLFGNGEIAASPEVARTLTSPFYENSNLSIQRLNQYLELARQDSRLNLDNIYAIGYCFGGTQVLNWARSGVEIKGVASFHGSLSSPLQMKADSPIKILVQNGAADPLVPARDIKAFKVEMKKAKARLTFHSYKGALHAFTNPDATLLGKRFKMPVAYHEMADKASWDELIKFLKN